ncbi:MAG: hypothetical protein IH851_06270 [Armatimonadetes bacterium]|nr:hypothetical protein [Armatimonadota bacterium]
MLRPADVSENRPRPRPVSLVVRPCAFATAAAALVAAFGCRAASPREQPAEEQPAPLARSDAPEGPVSLRLNLAEGDRLVYEFTQTETQTLRVRPGSADEPGTLSVSIEADLVQTCVAEENGVYEVEHRFENIRLTVACTGRLAGNEETIRRSRMADLEQTSRTRWDARFQEVVDGAGDESSGQSARLFFPDRPVRPGDTWEAKVEEVTAPGDPGALAPSLMPRFRYTLEGFDRVGEWRTARVRVDLEENPLSRTPVPGYTWIDLDTGVIVRSEGVIELEETVLFRLETAMNLKEFGREGRGD